MKNCDPGTPCYTLREMLGRKSAAALRKIAKTHKVKGYTKKDKNELIVTLTERICGIEGLMQRMIVMNDDELGLFCRAATDKELLKDPSPDGDDDYEYLLSTGLIVRYCADGRFCYVVPEEVKAVFAQIYLNEIEELRTHANLIVDYAIAAVNLYGVISLDEFVNIFNCLDEDKTTRDEVSGVLYLFDCRHYGYAKRDSYLIDSVYEDDTPGEIESYARHAREVLTKAPFYLPYKEEFLRYVDWDYYPQTPETKALEKYLRSVIPKDRAELVGELTTVIASFWARSSTSSQDYVELLADRGLHFPSDTLSRILDLIFSVHNHSRVQFNSGRTLTEAYGSEMRRVENPDIDRDFFR